MAPKSFSQHFTFFVTYKLAKRLVLQYTRLEMIARDKNSSLLGPFASFEENEVL